MKPATTIADNGAFSVQKSIFGPECISIRLKPQKSIFEFALRARKITILGALATQFHEISGLNAPNLDFVTDFSEYNNPGYVQALNRISPCVVKVAQLISTNNLCLSRVIGVLIFPLVES
jgi:hypothetical protein